MDVRGKLMVVAVIAGLSGVFAMGQFTVPDPPPRPAVVPPAGGGAAQPENLGAMELRIALQKAQIQAATADKIAEIREGAYKTAQERVKAGQMAPEDALGVQADALVARAGADSAKLDVAGLDLQMRAGPAALQQAQMAQQQPGGAPNTLLLQLMENDLKKVRVQSVLADQMVKLRQQLCDALKGKTQVNGGDDRLTDALVDLEGAKAAQQTAVLDEQLMTARYVAAGGKR